MGSSRVGHNLATEQRQGERVEGGPSALGGGGHKPGGERVEARLRSQERTPGWGSQGKRKEFC